MFYPYGYPWIRVVSIKKDLISRLRMIVRVNLVLNRTVVGSK